MRGRPTLILAGLDAVGTWDAVIDAEPALAVVLSGERFDAALVAIANFVDLKSPYTLGHARAVADLAAEAGAQLGLPEARGAHAAARGARARLRPARRLERDLGQARAARRRRVGARADAPVPHRAHAAPVRGARAARRDRRRSTASASTAPATRAASPGAAISRPARILGAADAYQAMREPRPHRPRAAADEAAAELRAEVRAGRLDADAVEAVLGAAGHRVPRRREGPAGLTAARGRGAAAARAGAVEQGDRRSAW